MRNKKKYVLATYTMRNLSNYNPGRPELLCLRSRRTKPKIMMDKEKIMTARPLCEVRVHEVEAEFAMASPKFAMARDHDGQAEFAKSRPSSRSPGQRSRWPGEDDGRDHDGQARTTAEITTARRGRWPRSRPPGEDNGQDDDGQARTTGGTTTARPSSRWPG